MKPDINLFAFAAILIFLTGNSIQSQDLAVVLEKDTLFENILTVKVLGHYSKILVSKSNNRSVELQAVLKASDPEGYDIQTITTNNVLEISVIFPKEGWSSHAGELSLKIPDSVKVDVQTTSGYCTVYDISPGKLNISTKSGKININKCKGDVLLATASGSIHLDEMDGNVNVKTKTGNIYILRTLGDVVTHTTLGNTHLENITGNINSESTSGKQTMDNVKGDIVAKAISGPVKISLAKGTISISGGTGDVQLFQTTGVLDVKTTRGNQSGTRISLTGDSRFTSTEGKIKMRFSMPKNLITYQLTSERAFVFALGKSKKKKLSIGKGKILVEASSTTGAQAFY